MAKMDSSHAKESHEGNSKGGSKSTKVVGGTTATANGTNGHADMSAVRLSIAPKRRKQPPSTAKLGPQAPSPQTSKAAHTSNSSTTSTPAAANGVNTNSDADNSTVPLIAPAVAPTQVQPRSTSALPPFAHAAQGLTNNFYVSFDIDSLTPTQMRLIIARAAQTHPTIIAASYSHVLNMILEERQISNLANRESSITKDVPLYKLIGTAGDSSAMKDPPDRPPSTKIGLSNTTAPVNGMAPPTPLPPTIRGSGPVVDANNGDNRSTIDFSYPAHLMEDDSASPSPPPSTTGKRSFAKMESMGPRPQEHVGYTANGERAKRKQVRSKCFNRTPSVSWDERFQMLNQFKAKYGHLQLKRGSTQDPVLGQWCSNQRAFRNMLIAGKTPYKINPERIDKLTSIGFQWAGVEKEKVIVGDSGLKADSIQMKAQAEVDASANRKDEGSSERTNDQHKSSQVEKQAVGSSTKTVNASFSSLQV